MTIKRTLALAAILVVAVSAFAQGGGGGGQRGGAGQQRGFGGQGRGAFQVSEAMLLGRTDVQKDLKLTDEQKTKLQAIQQEMGEKMRAQFAGGRNGGGNNGGTTNNGGGTTNNNGGAGRNFDMAEIQKQMEAMQKEANDKAKAVLTEEQWKRLGQIKVQLGGPQLFLQEDFSKQLGLKAQQKIQINDLMQEQQTANQQIFMKMRDQNADREALMAEIRKNEVILREEIVKLLTDDQKKTLADLEGPKFTADPAQNNFGGFGGRNGGGRNNGGGGGGATTGGGAAGTRGGGTGGGGF